MSTPKPVQLPPQWKIPRKQANEDRGDKKKTGVMRCAMFFLVPDDIAPLEPRQREHPLGNHHF